jgi:hypothetical protein
MAKFYGKVGYVESVKTKPGVWDEAVTERSYYGDVLRNVRRYQTADKTTDDINVDVRISIVADPYANDHFHSIRYVEFMGTKWEVPSVEPQYPRLLLTLGGVYNG